MIITGGCYWGNLTVQFLLWIICVLGFVDYFHKNSERKISVVIQLLSAAI